MARRRRARVAAAGSVIAAFGLALAVLAYDQRASSIVQGPYLLNVGPNSATIMWETEEAVVGVVEYGPTAGLGARAAEEQPAKRHRIDLSGLDPQTRYSYRIAGRRGMRRPAAFTTAFVGDGVFTFAVYGDTRSHPEVHEEVVRRIATWQPTFVLHTGDLVYNGDEYALWREEFFEPAEHLLKSACLWPVHGNHDGRTHFYDLFPVRAPDMDDRTHVAGPTGRPRPDWYAFRWGNAKFVALDPEQGCGPGSEQGDWLVQELARGGTTWTFVFLHDPPYSSGAHGSNLYVRQTLVPLLEQHGVDLVFCGHDHLYERTYPLRGGERDDARGIVYVTTAGGGAPLYGFQPQPWSAVVVAEHHACLVRVNGLHVRVEAQTPDGTVLDAFDLRKPSARSTQRD
jgi:predicted phosphodiesterase